MKLGQFTVTDEFVADCPAVWSAIRRACVFKEWIERLYVGQGQHVATLRNREGPWPS